MSEESDNLAAEVVDLHRDLKEGPKREQILTAVKEKFSQLEKDGRLNVKSTSDKMDRTR